jgi:hypothetical protein
MKKLKLCLHTGGEGVSLAQVKAVRTPKPTETYYPIPHIDFIDQVRRGLDAANLEVVEQEHALAKDGKRYFGLLQVARTGMKARDYSLVIGLRNTHDKVFPAGMVAGAGVFVCDNLAFSGEVDEFRKHTLNIHRDLPIRIGRAIGQLSDVWVNQEKRFDTYKETTLDKTVDVDHLLMEAWRQGAAPLTHLAHVYKEWTTPTHEEFKLNNVWRLFNAFTEVGKKNNIAEVPERTMQLRNVLDGFCGIELAKPGAN